MTAMEGQSEHKTNSVRKKLRVSMKFHQGWNEESARVFVVRSIDRLLFSPMFENVQLSRGQALIKFYRSKLFRLN